MPAAKFTGNPMGSGNPPGEYSKGYLSDPDESGVRFDEKSYRGDMHVGIPSGMPVVGNQPQEEKSGSLITNNPALR